MALFKKEQFEELAKENEKYCISIYIPTRRGGENKESMINLKNEIKRVEKVLKDHGLYQKEIDSYVKPIKNLLEDVNIWRHLSDVLALFRSKNRFEYYTLPMKGLQHFSQVSDRFYILPLVDMFNRNQLFYILALSLNKNRLFEATQHELIEIDISDVLPKNKYDSAGHDVVQKSVQMRGEQSGEARSTYPGKAAAIYHGKGEGKDDKEIEMQKYLEDVDRGMKELLNDNQSPIVVASVENLFAHFKENSTLKNLYPECIPGNHDNSDALLLHEQAVELLQSYFEEEKNSKKESYSEANGKTTSSLEDIVVSADAGAVDTLFIARGEQVWGDYNREERKIEKHDKKHKNDKCLLNFAARTVILKGGKVFIEEQSNLPENTAPANAILRY